MTKTGIDISAYQDPSQIDYDTLSKNVDFAILRAGYSGWGDQAPHKDDYFEKHYSELHKRNVPLGAYYFSTADTKALAEKEADAFLSYIKGKEFTYPVSMDVEDEHNQAKLSKTALTDVVITFLDKVEKAGYFVNIYCSEYWIHSKLEASRLTSFDKWIAKWSSTNPQNIEYGMWQFSSDFRVAGYNSRLDGNRSYRDYPAIIKEAKLNNTAQQPEKKSVTVIVDEILKGLWGNGQERKDRLSKAGYDYSKIQNEVNKKLAQQAQSTKKPISTIVNEVLQGLWGNGQERKDRLNKAGYDYSKVQDEVNKKLNQNKTNTYKVKAGDSWWSIAEAVYGDGQKMYDLAKKNGKTINHVIHPNDVLKY